jgi:hypothetical protein
VNAVFATAQAQNITLAPPITTVAGNGTQGYGGDSGPATSAEVQYPFGVAVDSAGNLYIADFLNQRIRKVDASGTITTVAGNGTAGFSGDNGPATSAELYNPYVVTVDSAGNLYIADTYNSRIRKVDTSGTITTVAGNGTQGYNGDNIRATSAELWYPIGVAVDSAGNLYIVDSGNYRIRKVDTSGTITTVAGNGTAGYNGDNIPATSAELSNPVGVAVDSAGNVYIADTYNQRIRKVETSGTMTTVAGNGTAGYNGDNIPATSAELQYPYGVAVDSAGNVYIADLDNSRIRKMDTVGTITTVAGTGTQGYSGDNGPATSAELQYPFDVVVDSVGNLYVADTHNSRVRKVTNGRTNFGPVNVGVNSTQNVLLSINTAMTLSAMQTSGDYSVLSNSCAPNTPLSANTICTLQVQFTPSQPGQRSFPLVAAYFISCTHCGQLIPHLDTFGLEGTGVGSALAFTPGIIATVAGNGIAGYNGDNIAATSSELSDPFGVGVDSAGNLYIADLYNNRIRKVDTSGPITTVAGNGTAGYNGDNIAATSAELAFPDRVAVDSAGNLYIADQGNQRIRKVDASGTITTVAGNGTQGYNGDNIPATSAELQLPYSVAVDSAGNLYIADFRNQRIRKVDTSGTITTVAGNGTQGYNGDIIPATSAELQDPYGVAVDSAGNVYIADRINQRIRKVGVTTAALSFSSVNVGQTSSAQSVTVSNVGTAALHFNSLIASSNFLLQGVGNDCVMGSPLAVGATCALGVAFAPSMAGNPLTGTLTVTDDAFNSPQIVSLTGTATIPTIPAVGLSALSLSFGDWGVKTTSKLSSSMLTNTGNAGLSIASILLSGDFALVTTGTSCPYAGGMVNVGASCTIDVTFTPTTTGTRIGAVAITDNAADSPQALTLSGTGVTSITAPGGLQSWWPGEGNFNDIRGPNNGTTAGGVTFVPGEVGQAFHFSGAANSYFTVPNSTTFAPANNQVTITAWIRPDFTVSNVQDTIFSKRDGCGYNRSYLLTVSKAGAVGLGYPLGTIVWSASVAGDDVLSTLQFQHDNQFHFVAGTYDGSYMNVYLDGVLVGQKAHTDPIPATLEQPYIGLQGGCGDPTAADIDELQFYNIALSQSEILSIYNAANAGVSQNAPVPLINQPLVPAVATPGGQAFTLTVNGTGFVPGAAVNWNDSALATTFVNSEQLTAAVPAADIVSAGTESITVFNPAPGGGFSNTVYLDVTKPTTSVSYTKTNYAAGTAAVSVTAGDFNHDGKLDLAVANFNSNNISVLLGNGDGTFQTAVNYPVGTNPVSVTVGDFNGDGKLDLAVANNNSNNVSVLLGNGDGTFQTAVNYPVGIKPFSVTASDFNGDGKVDLAVANGNSYNVSVLLGNGDGIFQPAVNYAAGDGPLSVAVGDFNADGKLDLAVANNNGSNLSVLLGNGDGTFQPPVNYGVSGLNPRSVVVADFNGDGKLDLAVANYGNNTISVLLGNGDGTFQAAVSYDVSANLGPQSVTVGDFNGDGKLDLAVALTRDSNPSGNGTGYKLNVLLGNADGTFQRETEYAAGCSPGSVTVGDFNGDGRIDLAAANYCSNDVSILLQAPVASFSSNSLTFPSQNTSTTSTAQPVQITNSGSTTLIISNIALTGANPSDFAFTSDSLPISLAPAGTTTLQVTFAPKAVGIRNASLSITDNASDSQQSVSLSGTATQVAAIASANSATLIVGTAGSVTVTATGTPAPTLSESGTLPDGLTFSVSTGVLSGTPAAGTNGTYPITFTATNGVGPNAVQNFTLRVIALQSISVTPGGTTLSNGLTLQFTATGTYTDASTRNVTSSVSWTSSKASTATITAAGLATAVSPGTSNIQAASGSISGSTTLTVTAPALVSISVTPANPTIHTGGTQQFVAVGTYTDGSTKSITTTVAWGSSNAAVATISSGALATGGTPGTATINATLGTIVGTTTLSVQPALVSVSIAPFNPSIKVGTALQFTATGRYSDNSAQDVTASLVWTSSKTTVATITATGLATAVAKGNANIKAKLGAITSTTTLTVTP